MKKTFAFILTLSLILTLCLLFSACEKSRDEMMDEFYRTTSDGQYNAIKISLGNNEEAIYFLEHRYGIWNHNGEDILFNITSTLAIQCGGELIIQKCSDLSYYEAIVECSNFYFGDDIFVGYPQFSEDCTVATFLPDNIVSNEMSSVTESRVIMTKIKLPESEIIPFDEPLSKMNFVPDTYISYTSNRNGRKFFVNSQTYG